MAAERDGRLAEVIAREQSRLRRFIRRRVADPRDVEDVLQDVFYRLVEANRLLMPIEHVTAWLFRVARNRIVDLFRARQPAPAAGTGPDEGDQRLYLEDLLASPDAGPEALFAQGTLADALEAAIQQLPRDQREVFVAHEIEGRSFKDIAARTGVNVNTLLSRKRYAVLRLREQLKDLYEDYLG